MNYIFVTENKPCAVGIVGKKGMFVARKRLRWLLKLVLMLAAKQVK